MAKTGSRLTITAATEKAGHGGSLDFPVIDEAFAYTDARLEQALLPAMRARRRFLPGPQLWIVSTAGNAGSTYLRGKVDASRRPAIPRLLITKITQRRTINSLIQSRLINVTQHRISDSVTKRTTSPGHIAC